MNEPELQPVVKRREQNFKLGIIGHHSHTHKYLIDMAQCLANIDGLCHAVEGTQHQYH